MDTAFTCSTGAFQDSSGTIHSCFEEQPSACNLETPPLHHHHSVLDQPHSTSANPASGEPITHTFASTAINNLLHGTLGSTEHPPLQNDNHHTTATTLTPSNHTYDSHSAQHMQLMYPLALTAPSALPPTALSDECISIYVIISVDESLNDSLWNHFNTSLFVTQPVTEEEIKLSNTHNSFACFQQIVEIPAHNSRHIREISARIFIKNYVHHTHHRFLFQLFLQVSHKYPPMSSSTELSWDRLDVVSFVQLPSTGQILRPIGRELLYDDALSSSSDGMFLGSFTIQDTQLYHHVPSEETIKAQEEGQYAGFVPPTMDIMPETVEIVPKEDIVQETNGARAGRPSHRLTGQLLMTRSQVEKILEIRARWHGLSPRQRRDNVAPQDFYTFLTLNRDETAQCLGVCATWLKDAIRAHGVNVWPGRPLRRSGATLQTLKENVESMKAALKFSHPSVAETERLIEEIKDNELKIEGVLAQRTDIVKKNVSEEYYNGFIMGNGPKYLNPEWNALPPFSIQGRESQLSRRT